MTIKLEAGKIYLTCMWEKVGPMHKNVRGTYRYRAEGYPGHWNENGISDIHCTSDIAVEWLDSDELMGRLQAAERQVEPLRAQLDAMREALLPFAVWADHLPGDGPDNRELAAHDSHLTYGDVRRTRAALKGLIK